MNLLLTLLAISRRLSALEVSRCGTSAFPTPPDGRHSVPACHAVADAWKAHKALILQRSKLANTKALSRTFISRHEIPRRTRGAKVSLPMASEACCPWAPQ